MLERNFQPEVIKDVKERIPGCTVLKNDANYCQGFPDLTILHPNGRWAVLETKKGKGAKRQPNQPYYVEKLGKQSFAAFICPENKEEVLDELQRSLESGRSTRVSKCK